MATEAKWFKKSRRQLINGAGSEVAGEDFLNHFASVAILAQAVVNAARVFVTCVWQYIAAATMVRKHALVSLECSYMKFHSIQMGWLALVVNFGIGGWWTTAAGLVREMGRFVLQHNSCVKQSTHTVQWAC